MVYDRYAMLMGYLSAFILSIIHVLRTAVIKDLDEFKITLSQVNLFYRLVSLPFLLLAVVLFGEPFFTVSIFGIWFLITIATSEIFSLYQVFVVQKNRFSIVNSFGFLDIVFAVSVGYLFFSETPTIHQLIGMSIVCISFLILVFSEKDRKVTVEIFIYYLLGAVMNAANKEALKSVPPMTFAFYLAFGLMLINLLFGWKEKTPLYRLENLKINKLLFFSGFTAGLSQITYTFALKLLPIGLVLTIFSSKTFLSLWVSREKYGEKGLYPQLIASVAAFVGIIILFIK